jgi:hypothetical protein
LNRSYKTKRQGINPTIADFARKTNLKEQGIAVNAESASKDMIITAYGLANAQEKTISTVFTSSF